MLVVLAHMAWLINLSALVVDVVPAKSLGLVFGLVAAGSSVGGMMMNKAVAWVVQAHDYTWCFIAMAVVHPLAWLLLRPVGAPRATEAVSPPKSYAAEPIHGS
jgi:ACS family hexuronate transporter-like MFS transporter